MAEEDESGFAYGADPELLEQFLSWTEDAVKELGELSSGITAPEPGSSETGARIYDLSHNIKGMGASFGYTLLTNVGQSLCSYIKDGDTLTPAVLQAHARVMSVILENDIQGDGGDKGKAIQTRLSSMIAEHG